MKITLIKKYSQLLSIRIFYFFIVFTVLTSSAKAESPITLAVHPYLPHHELVKKFTPLVQFLSKHLNQTVILKIGDSYDEHINIIGLNKIDIAYMGPASYIKVVDNYGNKPILARLEINGKPTFHGNIIVTKGSGIDTLQDLKGKHIAYGDKNSTMSFMVPHFMLLKEKIYDDPHSRYVFLNTHNNVALGVLSGDYDAGAVKSAVFDKFKNDGLYSVKQTPEISEHVFIANANLDQKKISHIQSIMFDMKNSPDGLRALQAIKKTITGLVSASDSDYDNLRHIINTVNKNK